MSRVREVKRLQWVELSSKAPQFASKIKGMKRLQRQGLTFEKQFGQWLLAGMRRTSRRIDGPTAVRLGAWLRFEDEGGLGWAQPDAVVLIPGWTLLFECKRTESGRAWVQLRQLYKPLYEKLEGQPIMCIQVCKYSQGGEHVVHQSSEWKDGAVFHWLGGCRWRGLPVGLGLEELAQQAVG